MENIRPVSDLRNHFSEISRQVHEANTPIFLTKNGYGDMVVLSMDTFQKMQYDTYVHLALLEAVNAASLPENWSSYDDMKAHAQKRMADLGEPDAKL